MEQKERKIGELFKDGNTFLETRKGDCPECFYNRNGCKYDNLAPFEGECPQWAKDAPNKLED